MNSLVTEYLQTLGFDNESVLILTALSKQGEMSVLDISRTTKIERTKVYRILDDLLARGFVVSIKRYKKNYYKIAPLERFEKEKKDIQQRTEKLLSEWPIFAKRLEELESEQRTTEVRYYKGVDGIKQILWNQLKAKGSVRSFTYRNLVEIVGKRFFNEWEDEFEHRGLICKDLRTREFLNSDTPPVHRPYERRWDEIRYLPDDFPNMQLAVDIYNNIVVLYDWRGNDIFAVEIQNQKFADFMKMVFDSFWRQATPPTKPITK